MQTPEQMNISELKAKQGKVEVQGQIVDLADLRTVTTANGPAKVRNGKLRDKTGEINLSLWNEDAEKVTKGDFVKISNGYVNEYRGELQLGTGRYGTLEILEKQKGLMGAVSDHAMTAATADNLEEADVFSGDLHDDTSPDEAVTADNLVENDEDDEAEKKPHPATQQVVEEDVVIEDDEPVE